MAALWTLVLTALLLSAGTTLADVDQDSLTSTLEGIRNKYALGDSFSLAVNVPLNQDPNNLQKIHQYVPADRVQRAPFVFSGVSDVLPVDMSQLGLNILIGCSGDDYFECTSCSSGGDVTDTCVTDEKAGAIAATGEKKQMPQGVDKGRSLRRTSSVPIAATDEIQRIPQGVDKGRSLGDTGSRGGSGGSKGSGGSRWSAVGRRIFECFSSCCGAKCPKKGAGKGRDARKVKNSQGRRGSGSIGR